MMKKLLLTMTLCLAVAAGFAQDTYYWVGGLTGTFHTAGNWNTKLDGTGNPLGANLSTTNANVQLVIDGTNLGGQAPITGEFTPNLTTSCTFSQLKIQNGANVVLYRTNSGATSGTSTITINGTNGGIDFVIDATSSLKLKAINQTAAQAVAFLLAATAKGEISGELRVYDGGFAKAYISVVSTARSLSFLNGAKCYINNTFAASYPLCASGTTATSYGIVFKLGSSLTYEGGNSPYTTTSAAIPMEFEKGSTFILKAALGSANVFKNHVFADVVLDNLVPVTINADDVPWGVDNLTINTGMSFYMPTTGVFPVKGNIVNNGTLGISGTATSAQLLMVGTSPQTISGSGTFSDLGALSVATDADVTLGTSLSLKGTSTASVTGTLNMATYSLTGSSNFQFRAAASTNSSTVSMTLGNNVLTFPTADNYNDAGISLGLKVVGTGIPNNTYIIATSSTNKQITLSNAPTSTISNATITISSSSPTLKTAHLNGMSGSVQTTGSTLSYGAGTNLIFDAATTTPFPTNATGGSIIYGDVTFNAPATTNKSVTINGKLALNNAKLTINEGDVVTMAATASFDGGFNASNYVVTKANTTSGAVGTLKLTDLSASTLIPVGSATNYLPVTLNPTTTSSFNVNVFAGATAEATPNGAALTADQKKRIVDAVWNINRTSGSGDVGVTLGWDNTLEGTDFAAYTDAQIGIATYNGTTYGTFTGPGNAAANTATLTTSTFAPFIVGQANTTLPLNLLSFTAKASLNSVKLAWQTTSEVNLKNYVLQHKGANGFEEIYSTPANNQPGIFNYNYTHLNPVAGVNYYRLVGVDKDGTQHVTEPKSVNVALTNAVSVYPNPATGSNISVNGVTSGDIVKVLNLQGQVIATQKAGNSGVQQVNVQNIQAGTYILTVENTGKVTAIQKVIKL